MRRLTLLLAGSAVWLFLAAVPVFADGGPHIYTVNNGSGGLTADSCAGCHRAHSAQGFDITVLDGADLCLVCHGATGTGATTDVVNGLQYAVGGGRSSVLGALRNGGFSNAQIGSGQGVRIAYLSGTSVRMLPKVPVASAPSTVTSRHMNLDGTASGPGVAWGNGGLNSGAGPGVTLECTSCHNPHGNGNYRILQAIPAPATTTSGTFVSVTAPGLTVTDDTTNTGYGAGTRNYTVIQVKTSAGYTLTATKAAADSGGNALAGDYLHRKVPWNGTSGTNSDAPNGQPSTFNTQITTWCSACHTRYNTAGTTGLAQQNPSGDAIYMYRHGTVSTPCTTCHVAHGSNAVMTAGGYAATQPWPGASSAPTVTGDSRLLKADNRGTCQLCHDPTGTITAGTQVGPTPAPITP